MNEKNSLINRKIKVINIGLKKFADSLREQGVTLIHVDWKPPAGGDEKILELLDKLL
jgi:FdrA protein